MKKRQFSFHLILFFCLCFPLTHQAVNSKPSSDQKETVHNKKEKGFKAWVQKRVVKKLEKVINKKSLNNQSTISIILGGLGLIALVFAVGALINSALTGAILFIPMILAIIGDILAINVLRKTRFKKEDYKNQRIKAKWGLGLSLAIGIIPLLLLVIFLIASS